MSVNSRLHQPAWLSGALHFFIIAAAAQAEDAAVWPYALLASATLSFACWIATYRRYRQIHDLPTSKVASAAQGYVELFGRAEHLPGAQVASRLSRTACCWYSYEIEERSSDGNNEKWRTVDSGTSVEHFLLVDDTGQCVVSPDGAEVLSNARRQWQEGYYRYTEWLLLPAQDLYAVGEFATAPAAALSARDEREEVGALLAGWKRDVAGMIERFDLDKDGRVDMKEWELGRLQAQREVRRQRAEQQARAAEGVHLLRKPRDGRLFLLANEIPEKLGARYRFWSRVHFAIFIAAGCAGLFML